MMDKNVIIYRLERIARRAVHTVGEPPFVMSLDDGMAVHEAIDIIQRSQRAGHWIFNQDDMTLTCSCCGDTYNIDDVDGGLDFMENAKYCISCGARMDEVKDED